MAKLIWIENHEQHIELLDKLKFKTKYFYIFMGCSPEEMETDKIIDYCYKNLKFGDKRKVQSFFGEKGNKFNHWQYAFEIENYQQQIQFFKFLSSFETFFHREDCFGKNESYPNRCDFGLDDIAFADEKGKVLCQTVTHEAMTWIDESLKIY